MNRQRQQKGRSHFGPALIAHFPLPEMAPAFSDDRAGESFSILGFGFSFFA